ncbi:Ribosomal large subunit pseudouridine synthase D [Minicystis rosea]|nr:Ribosomal large subunit pseudouridine synthase D [Minicystis rosea]
MSERLSFVAGEKDPRDRLDKLIVRLLAGVGRVESRAVVQRWIDGERVRVDGKPARASAAVPAGARIEVDPEPPPATTAEPDASIALTVVHEDAHLVIIDKPAGLVVHPARGHERGTLVNALLGRGGFERASADPRDPAGHLRPGIVHRLDKGTSGLLVVAKDAPTREALKALFSRHSIEREYVAIVIGEAKAGTIDTLHARHATDRLRFTSRTDSGRRAITHVRVLERLPGATLIACTLETGRTHQIRVHLAEQLGTPVLADPLYGKPPRSGLLKDLAESLGRQALHARVLGFVHPATGLAVRWESALPADMEDALVKLREAAQKPSR